MVTYLLNGLLAPHFQHRSSIPLGVVSHQQAATKSELLAHGRVGQMDEVLPEAGGLLPTDDVVNCSEYDSIDLVLEETFVCRVDKFRPA